MTYLIRSTEQLLEIYNNALRYYVENRLGSDKMHMEDFAVEVASFSECFYATIQALPKG
jgi:hypothetical protein